MEEEEEEEELQEFEGVRPGETAAAAATAGTAAPRGRSKAGISSPAKGPNKRRIRDYNGVDADAGGSDGETGRGSSKRGAKAARREKKAAKSGDVGGGGGSEDKSVACVVSKGPMTASCFRTKRPESLRSSPPRRCSGSSGGG